MFNLATQYRPRKFDNVVGQDIIKDILQNQITNNQFNNAYLFVGGSGVGKTTIARIFANQIDHNNIIEIDAASNSGVDNIRLLNDYVKQKPIQGRYKIIIIDECHMLSNSAWNALLKALEESTHAMFILCTTEINKVPVTIQTRSQRFHFLSLTREQITEQLSKICKAENINITDDALDFLAILSKGSMRKAITLLDTIKCDNINVEYVSQMLGKTDYNNYLKLIKFILTGQPQKIIKLIQELYNSGIDLEQFYNDFIDCLHNFLIYDISQEYDYTNFPAMYRQYIDKILDVAEDNNVLFNKIPRLIKYNEFIKNSKDLKADLQVLFAYLIFKN